jgi:hypothetical protein
MCMYQHCFRNHSIIFLSRVIGAILVQVESRLGKHSPCDERAPRTKSNTTSPLQRPHGRYRMQSACTPRCPHVRSRGHVRIPSKTFGGLILFFLFRFVFLYFCISVFLSFLRRRVPTVVLRCSYICVSASDKKSACVILYLKSKI